jgi:hypothetical protein
MPALGMPDGAGPFTAPEVKRLMNQAMRGVQETLAPDLRALLAALDDGPDITRCPLCGGDVAENALAPLCDAAPHGRATGQCEGCGCCNASGCHRFADATCPTNSLGDSVCPCTED